jgi:chromosome segregation ATPase
LDYIIKVESKGKKSDASVVYLIIMKEGNNMKTSFDAYQVDKVKAFLNSLLPDVEAENLELDIIAQEDAVNKAEKKLRGLKDDQSDLEKKLKNNQEDQRNTEKEIEAKKEALEALKGRRVNNKS